MERCYRFAGVEIAVSMPEAIFYQNEYQLAPFAVDHAADPCRFTFELKDALDPPIGRCTVVQPGLRVYRDGDRRLRYIGRVGESTGGAYIRIDCQGRDHRVQVKAGETNGWIGTKTVLNSICAEHLIARAGGFLLHCAFIAHQGEAILFTAPSGVGKSTQAELWHRLRDAEIVNGDRAAVRLAEGIALAEGIPFAGSSPYCLNASLPVAAVVYLSQAPVTTIRRLRGYEAFARIWEGCSVNTWEEEDMSLVSSAVERLAASVPVYHLACTPDESAVTTLENALKSR